MNVSGKRTYTALNKYEPIILNLDTFDLKLRVSDNGKSNLISSKKKRRKVAPWILIYVNLITCAKGQIFYY